jgi:arylformamidase
MRAVEIFDVSVPVRPGMPVYPGDPEVELERVESLADGAIANVSRLAFGVHTGSHVDAPLHFLDGAADVESLPVDVLVGPVRVLDLTAVETAVGAADLEPFDLGERILLRTRNSELWARDRYVEGAVELAPDAARLLVERGVRLVGIDYLSIGDPEAHRILLGARVVPVEGLDLRGIEPGEYLLVCAPLRLAGSDGGPARVLLIRG